MSRLAPNLYRDQESGAIVRTRSCYEYAERDSAILRWDGPSSGTNRLIFSSGLMCDVTDLDARRGPLTPDETLAR